MGKFKQLVLEDDRAKGKTVYSTSKKDGALGKSVYIITFEDGSQLTITGENMKVEQNK